MTSPAEPTSRLSGPAVLSLILGVAALVPPFLLIVTGLPALVMGYISLQGIHRSEGRLRGVPLAVAGMILGGIGTLVSASGFVLGMILEAREKANRISCENNYRLIGQAVNLYHDEHKEFPPGTLPAPALPPEKRWSWLAGILPYLLNEDKTPAAQVTHLEPDWMKFDPAVPWDSDNYRPLVHKSFKVFLCPSASIPSQPDTPGLTTYVGLAGVGRAAAALQLDALGAGFFGYDRQLTRDILTRERGSSRIVMVAETAFENGPWAAGGWPSVRGLDPDMRPYLGPGRVLGGTHRTGLNALFSDGSLMYFLNEFEPVRLEALVVIHGE